MANNGFYCRSGYVSITTEDEEEIFSTQRFDGLNFKFSCEITAPPDNGRIGTATVGILGLSGETVHRLTTFCNGMDPVEYNTMLGGNRETAGRYKCVHVYAGYEKTVRHLFALPISGAWPTSPPNMWLNIHSWSCMLDSMEVFDFTLASKDPEVKISFREYAQFVAKTIGGKLRWKYDPGDTTMQMIYKAKWGIVGTVNEIVKYLNRNAQGRVYIRRYEEDPYIPVIIVDNYKSTKDEGYVPEISAATGMIGLPKISVGDMWVGEIEVQTLLRTDIDIGNAFTVKSEYIPFANEKYRCTKIKHVGEFRGNPWYTTLWGLPVVE